MSRPLISERTMAKVRAISERAMPDFCEIVRPIMGQTPRGYGEVGVEHRATMPCRVSRSRQAPTDQAVAGQVRGRTVYTVALPHGFALDIQGSDRLRHNGHEFELLGSAHHGSFDADVGLTVALHETGANHA